MTFGIYFYAEPAAAAALEPNPAREVEDDAKP